MKTHRIKLLIVITLIVVFSDKVFSQSKYGFNGIVENSERPLNKSLIHIYKDDRLVEFSRTLSNGYFKLLLDYNSKYTIEFSNDGYKSKKIHIDTEIAAAYANKNISSKIFAVNLNKGTGYENNAIPVYKISPGSGDVFATGKNIVEKNNTNTLPSEQSSIDPALAQELLVRARIQADSIIQAAELKCDLMYKDAQKYLNKSDSLQKITESKIYENKANEYEGVSKENIEKLKAQNDKLKEILAKGNKTISDSVLMVDNRIESQKLYLSDLEKQLNDAELSGDSTMIAQLRAKIGMGSKELELMKAEQLKLQKEQIRQQKELKLQTQRLYMIGGLVLLLMVVLFVLFMFYRNKKKSNELLGEKNVILNQQKEEIQAQAENLQDANAEITEKNNILIEQKEYIQEQHEHIKASVKYASTIQAAILPIEEEMRAKLDTFVIFRPKDVVSGDFYWYAEVPEEFRSPDSVMSVLTAAVDCTGHGVPGAFMSMIGSRVLNEIVNEQQIFDTATILEMLDKGINRSLKQDQSKNNDGMDVSLCKLERLNTGEMRVTFTGAKRPLFIYDSQKQELINIKGDRRSVGGKSKKNQPPFTNNVFVLAPGSIVYMTSDGLIDQNNHERKRFGTEKFEEVLRNIYPKPLEKQKEIIVDEIVTYMAGEEQRDDMTVVAVKV